eukprot:1325391-Rhodomonas_salina.4
MPGTDICYVAARRGPAAAAAQVKGPDRTLTPRYHSPYLPSNLRNWHRSSLRYPAAYRPRRSLCAVRY